MSTAVCSAAVKECRSDHIFFAVRPEVRPANITVYTGLGQQFILSCEVLAWPRASLLWTRQNRVVRDSPRLATRVRGDSHYLFVYNVTETDFGEYVCQARNRLGVSAQSIVVVGETPSILPLISNIAFRLSLSSKGQ